MYLACCYIIKCGYGVMSSMYISCPHIQDAQFSCSVDTTNVAASMNTTESSQTQSTKLTEPFQFTASTNTTSMPDTKKSTVSPPPPISEDDDTMFSTPANQECPVIQAFSRSPYKTPVPGKLIQPSPLFTTPLETTITAAIARSDASPVFVTPNSDTTVTTTESKEVTNDESFIEDDKNKDVKPPSEITKGTD